MSTLKEHYLQQIQDNTLEFYNTEYKTNIVFFQNISSMFIFWHIWCN